MEKYLKRCEIRFSGARWPDPIKANIKYPFMWYHQDWAIASYVYIWWDNTNLSAIRDFSLPYLPRYPFLLVASNFANHRAGLLYGNIGFTRLLRLCASVSSCLTNHTWPFSHFIYNQLLSWVPENVLHNNIRMLKSTPIHHLKTSLDFVLKPVSKRYWLQCHQYNRLSKALKVHHRMEGKPVYAYGPVEEHYFLTI